MPSKSPDQPPSNVTEARQPVRKKPRLSAPSSKNNTPNAYARRSPPREQKRQRSPSPIADKDSDSDQPKKQKRPGAGARIGAGDRQAADIARRRREDDERKAKSERDQQTTAAELVAEHYNAVPERGREWRKTDSQIKGLRSLNNWVKSTLIQKFSRPEYLTQPGLQQQLCVLDMACGKGGDLGKWEKAPQVPALYVGCDIAGVSIDQARQRWDETLRKSRGRHGRSVQMQAEFYVHDTFSRPLGEVPRVRQVGFNPNAGPGSGVIQGGMMQGGFDVVSMMFALHYSYESEALARGMLANVAGVLKKGGRFIGVMPDSDVISERVRRLLVDEKGAGSGNASDRKDGDGGEDGEIQEEDDWDPEKPSEPNGANGKADDEDDDDWDPEKPSEPAQQQQVNGNTETLDVDDWDPTKPSEATPPQAATTASPAKSANGATPAQDQNLPPLEWGNHLYHIRFPRHQPLTSRPLPTDGIFRPPYGWRYHYQLEEAVDVPEYVVPWEAFRALAEDYGLELMYRKGFAEVLDEVRDAIDDKGGPVDKEAKDLAMLAERMGVMSRDRSQGRGGLLVGEEEMEAAGFYCAFCFYKT